MPADRQDIEQLRAVRRTLTDTCKAHAFSVYSFREPNRPWFRVTTEPEEVTGATTEDYAHHLSTSASCLQSLLDAQVPDIDAPIDNRLIQLIDEFGVAASRRPREQWQSEGAAHTYCVVRTLPLILESCSHAVMDPHIPEFAELIRFAWSEVTVDPPRQGIAEHSPEGERHDPEYPPNAFLTYWGLRTLRAANRWTALAPVAGELRERRAIAFLWAERTLGVQLGLHDAGSDHFDAHQLAWALATMVEFEVPQRLRREEVISVMQASLSAFFSAQRPSGGWPQGAALFHYPESGNAYCYTFETLTELLRPALRKANGDAFRECLRPYAENLIAAWQYADATRRPLESDGTFGWCSGHHPHRTEPEAWATAATFSCLQMIRRLVGNWSSYAAAQALRARPARWPTPEAALSELRRRGETWDLGDGWAVGGQLAALFLNPVLSSQLTTTEWIDPDARLIRDDQARSAILYGPPGTGKTSFIEALVGAIGWSYVEIHASDFVAEGMDRVPVCADRIFSHVMELDRCVILFDEIDELLRDRRSEQSDPFGRFLTTSMLPRLARLWEQRRVLFFANTNTIDKADAAIRRSQRFDAALLVLPISFGQKLERIRTFLDDDALRRLTFEAVSQALANETDHDDAAIGWFALLRYDQMDELCARLRRTDGAPSPFVDLLKALREMSIELKNSDWTDAHTDGSSAFRPYNELKKYRRIDGRDMLVIRVEEHVDTLPEGFTSVATNDECSFLRAPAGSLPPRTLSFGGSEAMADVLLWYTHGETGTTPT